MGNASCLIIKEKIEKNILWIDPNINNEENKKYSEDLKTDLKIKNTFNIELFKKVSESIDYLKAIKFEETKIIISGRLYSNFIKNFKENILEMYVAPKILVFTSNKKRFIENNEEYKDKENKFYTFGGVESDFKNVRNFIENDSNQNHDIENFKYRSDDIQLTFEYIDKLEKLMLPLLFKSLIEIMSHEDLEKYTKKLYIEYSKIKIIKKLLGQIESISNIPREILSRYYTRLYTLPSIFHKNLNKNLGKGENDDYISFVKILYEGVKLKSLTLASDKILYRGSLISDKEIEKIQKNICNKKYGLPGSIVFSRSFLSFSKDRQKAENFMINATPTKNLCRVLYILEKDNNIGYDLSTHCDMENISYFPEEKEILFFPFSVFEIKEIIQIENKIDRYQIKLLYLGKYLKDIKNDKNLTKKGNPLPISEYKKQLTEFGLIEKENIEQMDTKTLYQRYKRYKNEINEINYITGEICINSENKNKYIQIINSYENAHQGNIKENELIFKNKEEIKNNVEILINGEKIDFTYLKKFKKEGKYKIKYVFRNFLKKIDFIFDGCNSLISIDFSNFNTKNITNMSRMFSNCSSLKYIDFSYFYTKNVENMKEMFYNCKSLENVDLSNFNTENVNNMSGMFNGCESLKNIDLSKFNTKNVKDMSDMFNGCKLLKKINLDNFNTENVNNMSGLFSNCNSLENL